MSKEEVAKKQDNSNTLIKFGVIALIIVLVGFYILESRQRDFEWQMYQIKNRERRMQNENYEECVRMAHASYLVEWNNECVSRGLSIACNLDYVTAETLENRQAREEERCSRQHLK